MRTSRLLCACLQANGRTAGAFSRGASALARSSYHAACGDSSLRRWTVDTQSRQDWSIQCKRVPLMRTPFLTILVLGAAGVASASECLAPPSHVCAHYWQKAVVFVGTVREIRPVPERPTMVAVHFEVDRRGRGVASNRIVVQAEPKIGMNCGMTFRVGERYIVLRGSSSRRPTDDRVEQRHQAGLGGRRRPCVSQGGRGTSARRADLRARSPGGKRPRDHPPSGLRRGAGGPRAIERTDVA